jgi:hypothetical protein
MEEIMANGAEDALYHSREMRECMNDLLDELHQQIKEVEEPQLKAMFEMSSEVLGGLVKAFHDYEMKNEPAWRLKPFSRLFRRAH